jgi:MFS family permease
MLALLCVAELLGMSLWFTASAIAPQLGQQWQLDPAQTGWLTTSVQLGFVAGTALAALLNLADVLPSRAYFASAALLSAAMNALLAFAPNYAIALASRFLTGLCLAGVYPPALKMIATWFRDRRGLATGAIVGALTIGKAFPYLLQGLQRFDYRGVVLIASVAAVIAAALVGIAYRDGPEPFPRRPFSWGLVGIVIRHRETRLAVAGYLGHMWELYAMWTGIALFFYDYFARNGTEASSRIAATGTVSFAIIAIGGLGALLAGHWADRIGRENVTIASMAMSAACALVMGWLLHASLAVVLVVGLLWGLAVVADSAQFSALVTETAPPHSVGTALTVQICLGFLLTAVTIALMIFIQTRFGWPAAFGLLAIGPMLGIVAMLRLRTARRKG